MNNQQKNLSMVNIVSLKQTVDKLLSESSSAAIKTVCGEYLDKIKNGSKEEQLCESFVSDLSKVASSDFEKNVLDELSECVKANDVNIKLAKSVYALSESSCKFVAPLIENAVVNYMIDKNSTTRDDVRVTVSLFESDSNVKEILECLDHEAFVEKAGSSLTIVSLKEEYSEPKEKTYTQAEVDAIIENKLAESVKVDTAPNKHLESHIGLHGMITTILKEHNNNEKLKVFCGQYMNALNEGKAEELLYESFVSGISNWNYLSAVDTELSALHDRMSKYKQDIDLKKVMETMKETGSYYIVPLIEDVVVDYATNKSMTNRAVLMQRLESFEYDPFVRDIINLVTRDMSIENTVYLGESVESANKYVHTELVYSPIKSIKENECVFNVKGSYYARRGNDISKLTKKDVASLSESFKALCDLVNSSNVSISKELNSISVYYDANSAVISESEIIVNKKKLTDKELEAIVEQEQYIHGDAANFYVAVKVLNENFDNISYIDFVKRVVSNDGCGRSVDVFKLNENIFVNAYDEKLGTSTFYRNVNPIQCRNYINEHMEINASRIFEDVLPEQEDIENSIDEKKKEYESYIAELEDKKQTLLSMKEEGMDPDDIDNAISVIDKELDDTKSDYKKYQDDSNKFINGDDKDKDDELFSEPDSLGVKQTDDDDNKENGKDNDKKETESPEEMTHPLTPEAGGDNGDDAFGEVSNEPTFDEFEGVAEFDPDFDVPVGTTSNEGFEIVRVSYNKNVKTGTSTGKGEVVVIIPSVDANGDVHDETRKVTFYLDADRNPVINNEYMPLNMYTAIQNAILDAPETETISIEGEQDTPVEQKELGTPKNIPTPVEKDSFDVELPDFEALSAVSDGDKHEIGDEEHKPIERVDVETPAETEDKTNNVAEYPIVAGVYPEEIAPKSMEDFKKDLDKMKIEHTESEAADGECCMKLGNKAQAHALYKYFNEWMNYDQDNFVSFFPELKKCFDNKPTNIKVGATNEGVNIKGVEMDYKSLRENYLITLPTSDAICDLFGINRSDDKDGSMVLIPESINEAKSIYTRLNEFAKSHEVNQDITDVLESLGAKLDLYENKNSYKLNFPYNTFLEQKLQTKGFIVESQGSGMTTLIKPSEFKKAQKVLEGFYGKNAPVDVRDFFQYVCENVKITVKDERTGKTVEINTDDFNGKSESGDASVPNDADFESSFDNSTFKIEDSMAFHDDDESAEESDKDDKENGEEKKDEKNESTDDSVKSEETDTEDSSDSENETEGKEEGKEEGDGEEEKKDDEKPKKKFKFKAKSKQNESVAQVSASNSLNESVQQQQGHGKPDVMDYVKLSNGVTGQIICKQADGCFVVNVKGQTQLVSPRDVSLVGYKFDTVEPPFKYDEHTLKGCYESYVGCGLYINDVRVTPNDCKVQMGKFFNSSDGDEIDIIIEGQKTAALKKYIQINFDEVNEALNLGNYLPGKQVFVNEGSEYERDVLIHRKDYMNYRNINESSYPVRVLMFDENTDTHLMNISGSCLRLSESSDIYVPEYESLFESAIDKLK